MEECREAKDGISATRPHVSSVLLPPAKEASAALAGRTADCLHADCVHHTHNAGQTGHHHTTLAHDTRHTQHSTRMSHDTPFKYDTRHT